MTAPHPHRPALVVVPTYNERDCIEATIQRLFAVASGYVHLLVVDDASPDATADVVKKLAASSLPVHLIERESKQGLASAYLTAFRWALDRDYWAVVEMDADLSHDPAVIPALLDALGGADLAIGSRYVPGGDVASWGKWRRRLSRGANAYVKKALAYPVHDSTSGFRAYRSETLQELDLEGIRSEGYAFQVEMTLRVHQKGGRIVEIPITFADRRYGASKLNRAIVIEALARVSVWGLQIRLDRWGHRGTPAAG